MAAPRLADVSFARSVVLVMFPTDTGPSGVILNRPTELTNGLLFMFRMTPPPERAWWTVDDIYFSGDGELLETLLERPQADSSQRFFAGYASWAPGQLEDEIARGDWHVLRIDPDVLYDTEPDTLWLRMHQRATLPRARLEPGGPVTAPRRFAGQPGSIRANGHLL
ncbi:MAG: hypothetical protein AMJ66_12070 [Betaproteobacteria bacterium SG8_40]|nr:MAG: hypothetical protein AMJ66_12070 [Betaproteobacteria bacterium SG8_40]